MWRTTFTIAGAATLALAGVGCAAAPPRAAQGDAMAAIRSARELGAEEVPQASYHLELAREQVEVAGNLIQRRDMGRAERLLRRAELDAELAMALTREARTAAQAEATRRRIRLMRERYL